MPVTKRPNQRNWLTRACSRRVRKRAAADALAVRRNSYHEYLPTLQSFGEPAPVARHDPASSLPFALGAGACHSFGRSTIPSRRFSPLAPLLRRDGNATEPRHSKDYRVLRNPLTIRHWRYDVAVLETGAD